MRNVITKLAVSLLIGGLILAMSAPVGAWEVRLDFITGGGWFIIQNARYNPPLVLGHPGDRANFGWHGGVKNGAFWGNGNYIDHGIGAQIHSTLVTGYVCVHSMTPAGPDDCDPETPPPTDSHGQPLGTRDVCGIAVASLHGTFGGSFHYRVRMKDAGEPGRRDKFGIALYDDLGNLKYLAYGTLDGGGNIQLHKGNDSNTPPPAGTTIDCDRLPDDFPFT